MELILKTNDENSIAKIIALASELNVSVEQRSNVIENKSDREKLLQRIMNFKSTEPFSFGDPAEWERKEREDRDLPFSSL